ncbi:MAG: HAMP domain-containing sensor histidine kinase [Candidatus Thiodiazotropha sp.]
MADPVKRLSSGFTAGLTAGLTQGRLRRALALFFIALSLPSAILVQQAYSRLKWEAFHQHQQMAEELTDRVHETTSALIAREEARGFSDYAFLVIEGDPGNPFIQRSPLAAYPVSSEIPGLVGYFQVDASGAFSTPLLPPPGTDAAAYGVTDRELTQRRQQSETIRAILSENRLVHPEPQAAIALESAPQALDESRVMAPGPPASLGAAKMAGDYSPSPAGQSVFDQLSRSEPATAKLKSRDTNTLTKKQEALALQPAFSEQAEEAPEAASLRRKAAPAPRQMRKELSTLAEPVQRDQFETDSAREALRIRTFESEIDPFEFSLLESGHFVLYRKVWREGQRIIQGLLIEQQPFLREEIEKPYLTTALSQTSDLGIAYRGDLLSIFRSTNRPDYLPASESLQGSLLYRSPLNAPLGALELIFSVKQLPAGPGGVIITWVALALGLVLLVGTPLLYRLGLGQIRLARQQQDFVSAVSHELKTPLTSIRMYSEMLKEGWASDEKKREYYDYIHDESERLTRLINNVLQLARMTRNEHSVEMSPYTVSELLDMLQSKIVSQTERAGFQLKLHCPDGLASTRLAVDPDHFLQVFINLTDNAIKFSKDAEQRMIEISCALADPRSVQFQIRDWGPGITREHVKRIFELFYRSENELTRKTSGTGIGLALVYQLVHAMKGEIRVSNAKPGALFSITFPIVNEKA